MIIDHPDALISTIDNMDKKIKYLLYKMNESMEFSNMKTEQRYSSLLLQEMNEAVKNGDEEGLKFVMSTHDDGGFPTRANRCEIFCLAVEYNREVLIDYFLDNTFIDVNARSGYPLLLALQNGNFSVVEKLLTAGAQISGYGEHLLDIAKGQDREDIVELLKSFGATDEYSEDEYLEQYKYYCDMQEVI